MVRYVLKCVPDFPQMKDDGIMTKRYGREFKDRGKV